MSEDLKASLAVFLIVTIGYFLFLTGVYGSPATPLSLVTGCMWLYGKFNKSRWVSVFASTAGALSIGFAGFTVLYVLLADADYSDPNAVASISDTVWRTESTLLPARLLLKDTFGSTWWLVASLSITIALALLSPLIGSYGLVSKFGKLQGWLSRLNFALIAATTFTVFLPSEYGEVVERAHQAVYQQIEASLRRSEENTSHTLAAEIVRSSTVQLSPQQRYFYRVFISELEKWSPSVFRGVVKQETTVDAQKSIKLEHLVSLSDSGSASPEADNADERDTLSAARSLEQRTASRATDEKREAVEAVISGLLTKATPELDALAGQFVDVLVETIAEPLSKTMTEVLQRNGSLMRKIKLLGEALNTKIYQSTTRGIIQAKGFRHVLNADGEVAPDQIIDYAQSAAARISEELQRAEEQRREQAKEVMNSFQRRSTTSRFDRDALERSMRFREIQPHRAGFVR
jgi:hypothetical protein